jgi:hypothetical protein
MKKKKDDFSKLKPLMPEIQNSKKEYRKYQFMAEQREALWLAWDKKCFYCRRLLSFKQMTIDHVVPEWLEYHAEDFNNFLQDCPVTTIFPNFQVNDYCNWVPAHGSGCNFDKGEDILPPEFIILCLHRVKKNLPKVSKELAKLKVSKRVSRTLADLETHIERRVISEKEAIESSTKRLSEHQIMDIVQELAFERYIDEPVVVDFGLTLYEVEKSRNLKITHPVSNIYDMLEKELVEHLRSLSNYKFYYTEESFRDGESLDVRLVFPDITLQSLAKLNLSRFSLPCWTYTASHFYGIYGMRYSKAFENELQLLQGFYQPIASQ